MTSRADILIRSLDGEIVLVVEVKGMKGVTDEWAAKFRRNLYVHEAIPKSRYFMLAMPEYIYLWKNNPEDKGPSVKVAPHDYKMPSNGQLDQYMKKVSLDKLSENGLELVVRSWLGDLIAFDLIDERGNSKYKWLFDSGLYESIKNGTISAEIFA